MKCSQCGFENPEGKKFCGKCGTKQELLCPSCNSPNPADFEYCGDCGSSLKKPADTRRLDLTQPHSYTPKFLADKILTTRSSVEGERKVVTVLFADVANYTALAEKLDPEEVHEIMDGCFRILMDEIHRYEGTINQFTGDGVMALFGAPVAHEDHARRACHAALAIQRDLTSYGEKVEKDTGLPFQMRIGLNSGPVIVGAIGNDLRMDYTAVGDTTNLASRMQSLAEPGTIRTTNETYKLTRDYFSFASHGKITVKGKEEPRETYSLLKAGEAETRIEASVARGLTRFAGRKKEMYTLRDAFAKAASGSGQVVGIAGEAGVGKSRLLIELRNLLPSGTYSYLEGRCLHYGSTMPYIPVLDLLRAYFVIDEEREFAIRKSMKERVFALNENLDHVLPPFQDLLSLKVEDEAYLSLEPQAKRDKTFEALRDLFVRISQEKPLIIAIEDLHWIDRTTYEFFDYFIGWIATTHILLILLYRPEFSHVWGTRSYYTQIGVDQLSLEMSTKLVQSILTEGDVAPELQNLILTRTAGNPLFLEEFTYSLVENGSIAKKDHEYVLTQRSSEINIPESIQGIIAARIDRLQENLKKTMQVASVIGRDFAFRILQTITGMREDLKAQLMNLQGLEFIYEKQLFPELEYIFKHILTQEVAYNSLLASRRKELHERTARAIEMIYSERLEEFYEMLAYHYSKAENPELAYHYLRLSGDKATMNYAKWEALGFYQKAIDLLKTQPDTEESKRKGIEIRFLMSTPMRYLSYPDGSLDVLDEGEKLARELGDEKSLAHFLSLLSSYHAYKGEPLRGLRYAEACFQEADRASDVDLVVPIAYQLCVSYLATGECLKISEVASRAIAHLERTGRQLGSFGWGSNLYAALHANYGWAMALQGYFSKGESLCEKGLRYAQEINDLYCICYVEMLYAYVYGRMGDGQRAIQHAENALKNCEKTQFLTLPGIVRYALCWGYYFLGQFRDAREHAEKGLEANQAVGISIILSFYYYLMATIHFDLGDWEGARRYAEDGLKEAQTKGDKGYEAMLLICLGSAIAKTDPSQAYLAKEYILQGIATADELGRRPVSAEGYLLLGELYIDTVQREKTLEYLRIADANFRGMGMDWHRAKVNVAYAELWKREGDTSKAKESYRAAIDLFRKGEATGWVEKYEKQLAQIS